MKNYKMEIMAMIDGKEETKTLKVKATSYANATLKVYKAYDVLAVMSMTKMES